MTDVIAVVPSYNRAHHLDEMLPLLTKPEQGYSEVIVVDDASTDHSLEVTEQHGAMFVAGKDNLGAAGNRNRLLDGKYANLGGTILHFVDSDTRPISTHNAETIQEVFDNPYVQLLGGLVTRPDGSPMPLNFGPTFTLRAHVGGLLNLHEAKLAQKDPARAEAFRDKWYSLLKAWPNMTGEPTARPAMWVAEGNMAIPYDCFQFVGGFPPLRVHEAQGLGLEIAKLRSHTLFDPRIAVKHLEGGNQPTHRGLDILKATYYLIRTYGLARFILGDDDAVYRRRPSA